MVSQREVLMPLLSEEHTLFVITYKAAYQRCKSYLDAYFILDEISREATAFRNGKGPYTKLSAEQLHYEHRKRVLKAVDRFEKGEEGINLDLLKEFETLTQDLTIYREEGKTAVRLHKSILHTAFELLRLYLAEYEDAKKLKLTTYYNNLPYLHTRQTSLATLTRCHRNTMRDHIDRLKQIGFVEKYRERYAGGLEILVNWDVVFGKEIAALVRLCHGKSMEETQKLFTNGCEQLDGKTSKIDAEKPFLRGVAQKFTPLSSETSIQNKNKEIKTVEDVYNVNKFTTSSAVTEGTEITNGGHRSNVIFGNDFFGNEEKEASDGEVPNSGSTISKQIPQPQKSDSNHTAGKRLAKALGEKADTQQDPTPQQEPQQEAEPVENSITISPKSQEKPQYGYSEREHNYYLKYATSFWKEVRNKLYVHHFFTPEQEVAMIHKVAEVVFRNFQNDQNWQHQEWVRYYYHCIAALNFQHLALVNYGAYVTHPASYFSPENTHNGWNQNVQRFEAYKRKAKYYALKGELSKIELEAEQYRNGEGKYMTKDPQQLFQLHKQRLLKLKSPEVLQAFYELVAQKSIYTKRNFDLKP
ncbi:hypothetical protein V6R21_25065 [Limibacter armeniacum]|uniref:hypothetical protein n=1 Tax=Limibacter armeniacum TaxID=466084 RepID=UPI002FE59388